MKYERPKFISLAEGDPAPLCLAGGNTGSTICHPGSGADTNGCTGGGMVADYCAYGDSVATSHCADGNNPMGGTATCWAGTGAAASMTRCNTGTIVT